MRRLLFLMFGLIMCFVAFVLHAQEPALQFSQQVIEMTGEVNSVVVRDLDKDKFPEIIFQQGSDLFVYNLTATSSGTGFARSFICRLPADACIYDIIDVSSQPNLIYINNKGVNSMNLGIPGVGSGPSLAFSCPTIFRHEKFNAPLNKKLLFDLDGRRRAVVVPDNGKFRMVAYDDFSSGPITRTAELPVTVTAQVYNSNSIFEPLTAEVSLPIFVLADLNNDQCNDFITLMQNSLYGFIFDQPVKDNPDILSFKPAVSLMSIPEGAASQEIDFGYTLAPLISDINNDGCADIMVSDDREGTVYIYINQFNADKTFFAKTPSQVIRTNNWIIEHNLIDLNGDSLKDLVLVQMNKLGVMGGLQAILAKTLEWEIAVYLARPGKNTAGEIYPKSPDLVRSIKLPFSFSYASSLSLGRSLPKIQSPYIWSLIGDFNGDKMRDLLLSGTESQMVIYPGDRQQIFDTAVGAAPDLKSASQGYKLMGMPYGAPIISDLNNDGRSDMIIPLVRQDSGGNVSYSYEILLSR